MSKAIRKAVAPQPPANFCSPASLAVASAIQALHAGTAEAHQQHIALEWIIREAGAKAYQPYHASDRDTAFALGRLFVADLIVGLFNADLSSLRRLSNVET